VIFCVDKDIRRQGENMGGDNMENLLLHGDDSSSGESDSEIAVSGSAGASVQRQNTVPQSRSSGTSAATC
jgi:hypothetical protein